MVSIRRSWPHAAVTALAALGLLGAAGAADAAPALQTTTIEFDPQNGVIVGAAVLEVDVRVEDVIDLNAFDITVTFDPSIVQVVDFVPGPGIQMEGGSFLCGSQLVLFNTADNTLGTAHYATTQLACPPVSGSGVLFTIRFEGVVNGISDLDFVEDPVFPFLADPNGVEIPVTPVSGTVEVTDLLAVELEGFAAARTSDGVRLTWRTLSETGNVGFHVLRQHGDGALTAVNASLIPSRAAGGELGGADYAFDDRAAPEERLAYWLEDVDVKGQRTRHGPIVVPSTRDWTIPASPPTFPRRGIAIPEPIGPR